MPKKSPLLLAILVAVFFIGFVYYFSFWRAAPQQNSGGTVLSPGQREDVPNGVVFKQEIANPTHIEFSPSSSKKSPAQSKSASAAIAPPDNSEVEKILDGLVADLRSGNVDAALEKIPPDERPRFKFLSFFATQEQLNRIADALSQRRLINNAENLKEYSTRWVDDEGATRIRQFRVVKGDSGRWYVVDWYPY